MEACAVKSGINREIREGRKRVEVPPEQGASESMIGYSARSAPSAGRGQAEQISTVREEIG